MLFMAFMNKFIIMSVIAVLVGTVAGNTTPMQASSKISAEPKKALKTVTCNVELHCQNCGKKVKENISFEKGVKALDVNLEKKTVTVTFDPSKTDTAILKKAIEKLGYKTELVK